jgi:hypothetical protein
MTRPSIDHSALSPSGGVSKRKRKAMMERIRQELFGDGLPYPQCPQPSEREYLERRIAELEALADQGIGPRKHRREAQRLRDELQSSAFDEASVKKVQR